ncbi:hypothetical protein AWB71_01157 [Caballeronia peredens]|nr:hypothetical protein AWB71_01157 [Caballeronia peredens]
MKREIGRCVLKSLPTREISLVKKIDLWDLGARLFDVNDPDEPCQSERGVMVTDTRLSFSLLDFQGKQKTRLQARQRMQRTNDFEMAAGVLLVEILDPVMLLRAPARSLVWVRCTKKLALSKRDGTKILDESVMIQISVRGLLRSVMLRKQRGSIRFSSCWILGQQSDAGAAAEGRTTGPVDNTRDERFFTSTSDLDALSGF